MAKSKDSFNKDEKEKQRLKKKQEKEEKKELRKSQSKSQSFEDMIAYVDENGNITSTPPDPSKKKEVDLESIQIGVSKKEDLGPQETLRKGSVTFFNESKGYGFIKDETSQESIFVHIKALVDTIKERDKVTFEIEMTPKGKSAVNVKLLKK